MTYAIIERDGIPAKLSQPFASREKQAPSIEPLLWTNANESPSIVDGDEGAAGVPAPHAAADKHRSVEALARAEYERLHPDDTFDDLVRRARFSKEDRGLLHDWLAAARRMSQRPQK